MAAFSSSGEDAISRTLDVIPDTIPNGSIEEIYQITQTIKDIEDGDYKRIALQFPDELLHTSVPVYRALRAGLDPGRQIYVLADTTYGSCCVDEVAAQHVDADVVVHYGHACLSPTSRLPVIYVLGRHPVDPSNAAQALISSSSIDSKPAATVLLLCDVSYAYQSDHISSALKGLLPSGIRVIGPTIPHLAYPAGASTSALASRSIESPASETNGSQNSGSRRYILPPEIPIEDCIIFYIGGESLALTNLIMTHAQVELWSYNPQTNSVRQETGSANKLLMRRYATVQKARDADVYGILIGTLGVASYIPMIKHIRSLLIQSGKKSYTVSVGKLNPSKLANFMEIECFVLVACPENSVIDSKDFLRPIISPFELEIALGHRPTWTGKYVLDFDSLLEESKNMDVKDPIDKEEESDPDEPVFSLVTGKYRSRKRYGKDAPLSTAPDTKEGTVALRNSEGTVTRIIDSAAGEFLQGRTFRGLEQRLGQDAPSELEQGRSGVAKGYGETS